MGIRRVIRPRGSAGVLNVASFPSFGRVRSGYSLVTVTSRSRPCATPNKAEAASLNQDVSCSTPSSNPSASFITENPIHVADCSKRQITLQGGRSYFRLFLDFITSSATPICTHTYTFNHQHAPALATRMVHITTLDHEVLLCEDKRSLNETSVFPVPWIPVFVFILDDIL